MVVRRFAALLGLVLVSGCYHATIETGLPAGTQVIDQKWAMSYAYGLVPPNTVNAASQCATGVARVETRHSFMNQLVGGLTFGIVTPMHIRVTCAAARSASADAPAADFVVRAGASEKSAINVFAAASDAAVARGQGVTVRFEKP